MKEQLVAIKAGQWGTITIDTGTQFCDWVAKETITKASPQRVEKQSMLVWGDAKHKLRQYIMDIMAKAKVVVITANSRLQKDGVTREARILEPVYALSDLFIELGVIPTSASHTALPCRPHPSPASWPCRRVFRRLHGN